ncbi:MAG TPA: dihydroneopterin aldolase [Stellaceae bacterium]|nr:dihydroneopterin aldolase [Stellaceae bacterium]
MSLQTTLERECRAGHPPEGVRQVLIRDLVMPCSIGVHAHEELAKQRVRLNLELEVAEAAAPIDDKIENVVCYDEIISGIRRIVDAGHVRLIETLAERIAQSCLADPRVRRVRVQVEKLDVYDDVASVGIAIERVNLVTNPS